MSISNNKSTQFSKINCNSKLIEELKFNLSQKNINNNNLKRSTHSINFESLRKNLLASYSPININGDNISNNKEKKIAASDIYKFDKMEFFKRKNQAIKENDYSKEILNTEPIMPTKNNKDEKEDFCEDLRLNRSNYKIIQEEKISYLDKLEPNFNLILNSGFIYNSESNKNKSPEETKRTAKPFLLSESVNMNFKPLDFLKKKSFIKNINLNLSSKFQKKCNNFPKENSNFDLENKYETNCEERSEITINIEKAQNNINKMQQNNENSNLNVNEKINLFNIHTKNEQNKILNKINNRLTDEDSNGKIHWKKCNWNF
jgi:hypothetical protein